ncbi:hypothetical protein [Brucella gallinifaecis]|uniref:hypothetical protein n=1 Tax=Brucella gallinifaecis TaxID=215590 RepID=UPI002361F14F|nr:hypothetical protein [Brucella gallinifaecis]
MMKNILTIGLLSVAGWHGVSKIDFSKYGPEADMRDQFYRDKHRGHTIIEGKCDTASGRNAFADTCNDPRYQVLIKSSPKYDPKAVVRWKETFIDEWCGQKRFKAPTEHVWCKPYEQYTVYYDEPVSRVIQNMDKRRQWLLANDRYKHACYYVKFKEDHRRNWSACPSFIYDDISAHTHDWTTAN